MEVFTLTVAVAISNVMMAITASLLYLSSNKKADRYLLDWTLASISFLFYGICSLASTKGYLEQNLVPLVPNTLFLIGHATIISGVYNLAGKGSCWKLVLSVLIFSVAFHSIPAVSQSFVLRAYFLYPLLISLYAVAIIALWQDRSSKYKRAYIPLVIVFGLYILQTLLRSFIAIAEDVAMEFLGNDIIQTSGTLATIAFFFALSVCFSLTVSWRKEVDLREIATTDHLTGWLNRSTLEITAKSILAECERKSSQAAFILIDIDKFKSINDRYGHAVGDMAIKHVCQITKRNLRGYDKCFRLGGEEFLIIVKDTSSTDIALLSDRIRQSIENTSLSINKNSIYFTVSLGFSLTQPGMTWLTGLEGADRALYEAKSSGRNKVIQFEFDDAHAV